MVRFALYVASRLSIVVRGLLFVRGGSVVCVLLCVVCLSILCCVVCCSFHVVRCVWLVVCYLLFVLWFAKRCVVC